MAGQLDSVTAASQRLERQTDDLGRERPRDRPRARREERGVAHLRVGQAAEAVARITATADPTGRGAQALARGAARERRSSGHQRLGLAARARGDPGADRSRAHTRAARAARALQQALKDLDAERAKDALERLAEAQKELREALERSRELFRRAALEGDLANLGKESQRPRPGTAAVEPAGRGGDSSRAAGASDSLPRGPIRSARRSTGSPTTWRRQAGRPGSIRRPSRPATRPAQMRQAADRPARAAAGGAAQGEQAARSSSRWAISCSSERQDMQQEWRQEVTGARSGAGGDQPSGRAAARGAGGLEAGDDPSAGAAGRAGRIEEGVSG